MKTNDLVKTTIEGMEGLTFTIDSYSKKFKWFYCICNQTKVRYSIKEINLIKI